MNDIASHAVSESPGDRVLDSQRITETLPGREQAWGPVTRRRQRNTLMLYAALCAAGLLPSALHLRASWQAFGLGLLFPGAGFIAAGGWQLLWLPLSLLLFAIALFAWFATGNVIAPVVVWLLSALAAMAVAHGEAKAAPYLVVTLIALTATLIARHRHRADVAARVRRDARIAALPAAILAIDRRAGATPELATRELTARELQASRFLYDRALQPVDELEGFDIIEQFQPAALRYQIFDLQYTLASLQCQYAPNFHGYLSLAQRNLIERVVRPEIWGYWKWESMWGRLTTKFDPVVKDNIMLTGFYLLCLNLYASNTGDHRYAQPDALEFWLKSGQRYRHDAHSIGAALARNFAESAYCLYPCEPNWIYTFCNLQGMTALVIYDRLYGTNHVEQLRARFLQGWREEFTTLDGSVLPIRSSLTGLTIPGLIGVCGDAAGSVLAAAVLPDIARRMWAQVRSEAVGFDDAGRLTLKVTGADKMDPGNYRKGLAMTYTTVMFGANEYGDQEIADAAAKRLDEEFEPVIEDGALGYRKMSTLTNSMQIRARINRRGDWRRAIVGGPASGARNGPILSDAAYPEVLVAKAISDGAALDLVLYPGSNAARQRIGVERLHAQRRYRVTGVGEVSSVVADHRGRIELDVVLDGRTVIGFAPEPNR